MKYFKQIAILVVLMFSLLSTTNAQEKKFTHKIVVGYNFGATAPIPIPRSVRSITAYWPQFTPQLGYNIGYHFNPQWSMETGITLDTKGMGVKDKVKYMYTDVIMDGNNIKGYFSGRNETKVKISYVTVPIRLAYDITPRWTLRGGAFFAYRESSEFSGTVWDGTLRQTDDKDITNSIRIDIPNKNEATFDFGKEMRNFDIGLSLGFEHEFIGRFGIYGDMTYSLTPIFPSSFKGIDMKMRNMYVTIGASYKL